MKRHLVAFARAMRGQVSSPSRDPRTIMSTPVRIFDQLDELERAIEDMPSVVEVRIARAYAAIPLRPPRSPIVIAAPRPWPPVDLEGRILNIPGDDEYKVASLRSAIALMEETFDGLPEAARAVWTEFWELAGRIALELDPDTAAPFSVPTQLLAHALDAIPIDTLSRHKEWAEMREALGRATCPVLIQGWS